MRQCFLALLFVVSVSAPASAQISIPLCGDVERLNDSHPQGSNGWLRYTATTTTNGWDICVLAVSVQARVAGIANSDSGWMTRGIPGAASVSRDVPAPATGSWITVGRHGYYMPDPFRVWSYIDLGQTQSAAWVVVQTSADACLEQGSDYVWDGSTCQYNPGSPLLVDTGRKGYRLTSIEDGVLFDLDGDGQKEQVSWTAAGVENAWIAHDLNRNGTIDSGAELYGTATPMQPDPDLPTGWSTTFNGFEALRASEQHSPSPFDDAITPADAVFSSLLLWTDRNHNGVSEPDELAPATSIRSLSLIYKVIGRRDRHGNTFRQRAPLTWADGHPAHVYDVWLRTQP